MAARLKEPRKSIPKNKRAFAGLKNSDEPADVLAHLRRLSEEAADGGN
ncbi:MAG: hypothetical protein AAGF59_07865 [Pseudomonadota bacterium]